MQFVKSVTHSYIVQPFANSVCFSRTPPTYVRSRVDTRIATSNPAHKTNYSGMDYIHVETRILLQILGHHPRANDYHTIDEVCAVKAELHTS